MLIRNVATPRHGGYALVAGTIMQDARLSLADFKVYCVLRLHDYGRGGGCYMARAMIATEACISERQAIKSLRRLDSLGYITTTINNDGKRGGADGKSTNIHFCNDAAAPLSTGAFSSPLEVVGGASNAPVEPIGGAFSSPDGCIQFPKGGELNAPKVEETEVNELKNTPTHVGVDAAAVCGTLGVEATPTNVKAMDNLLRRWNDKAEALCHQSVDEMATEARAWLEGPKNPTGKGRSVASVAFLRNWVSKDVERAEARAKEGGGVTGGRSHAAPRAEARAHEVAPNYQRPPVAEPPPPPVCTINPRELMNKMRAEAMADPEYRAAMEERARDMAKFRAGPTIAPLSPRPVAAGPTMWPA